MDMTFNFYVIGAIFSRLSEYQEVLSLKIRKKDDRKKEEQLINILKKLRSIIHSSDVFMFQKIYNIF